MFADDNFRFNEICGKFSERVDDAVRKVEIADCKKFLLFPQTFQKYLCCRHIRIRACFGKSGICFE